MIDYRRLGHVSPKPHTVFEVDGKMVAEHVFTRDGFGDLYSILYQRRAPTHEKKAELYEHVNRFFPARPSQTEVNLKRRHVRTPQMPTGGNLLQSRATLFCNNDVAVGMAKPDKVSDSFFVNADADELYFVAEGGGVMQSMFGELDYNAGDYVYIPKAVPYRFVYQKAQNFFIVEGSKSFGIPKEFRLPQGQLRLDAPFTHRDFRSPSRLCDFKSTENFPIIVKRGHVLSVHEYENWPYEVVGWDGWVYPFAFNVLDYQPKTSTVHLPPSIHLSFAAQGFVMMNFVPRMVDYHPQAIPCPYPHSSVDCEEILFYVKGNFTSRAGIEQYSISYHPGGIPHGPHPEKYEASVGARYTDELAIMVDTFAPVYLTEAARQWEDAEYHMSWNTPNHL